VNRPHASAFALLLSCIAACGVRAGDREKALICCTGEVEHVRCDVSHTAGTRAVRVCWDLDLACKNGKKISERLCQEVQPRSTVTKRITNDEIMGYEQCRSEGAEISGISNTRVTLM
jgi:hypothetical protein